MTSEVRAIVSDAERAAGAGELSHAAALYIDAGRAAAADELWRIAIRCYRAALEIDLFERPIVARLLRLGARAGDDWREYADAIDRVDWPHFGCRGATIVTGDGTTVVRCPEVGPVLDIAMSERELIDASPQPRFARMPIAMALIVLRRALWPAARSLWIDHRHRPPMQVRVVFEGRAMWLDELGDWRRCNPPANIATAR